MKTTTTSSSRPATPRAVKRRFALYFLALLSATAVVVACGEGFGGFLISDQDELAIGQDVDNTIEQEYAIVADGDPVAQWALELTAPLEGASAQFRDPSDIGGYKVEVIADDELINAFAAPGGYTYLSTGLILEADTCAEIAGVMGHELAHVTERHSVKSLESAYGTALLTELILGEGLASDVVNGIQGFLLNTTYSRDKEEESDEIGLQISHDAGYNPYGLQDFFEKLLALQGGSSPPTFLSSHPATEDRIAAVDAKIKELYGNTVIEGQTQSYQCLNTQMSLAQVQDRIRSGNLQIRQGTGVGGTGQVRFDSDLASEEPPEFDTEE